MTTPELYRRIEKLEFALRWRTRIAFCLVAGLALAAVSDRSLVVSELTVGEGESRVVIRPGSITLESAEGRTIVSNGLTIVQGNRTTRLSSTGLTSRKDDKTEMELSGGELKLASSTGETVLRSGRLQVLPSEGQVRLVDVGRGGLVLHDGSRDVLSLGTRGNYVVQPDGGVDLFQMTRVGRRTPP